MKTILTMMLALASIASFSQTTYYHHGYNGLIFWENRELPEKDLFISSFGAKVDIKEEVGYLLYFAFTSGKLDTTMKECAFSTENFKVSGFLEITYAENAILIDFTYNRVQWPDGSVEIYKPLD